MFTLNGKKILITLFLNKEISIFIAFEHVQNKNVIKASLKSSDDIITLLLIVDAIKNINPNAKIDLTILYLPYCRQDRIRRLGDSFSLNVCANLINSIKAKNVTLFDTHSKVSLNKIRNCKVIHQHTLIEQSIVFDMILKKNLTLISPDKGESLKIVDLKSQLNKKGYKMEVVFCKKVKSINDCAISISDNEILLNQNCMIVDDICDSGITVLSVAKKLKERGVNEIYLYATHGIFSTGLDVLKRSFNHVFCYHTFLEKKDIDPSFLTVLSQL